MKVNVMATKQKQDKASQEELCRLEWISEAMKAARRHQLGNTYAGPAEYPIQDLANEDLDRAG